jgi:1-acyl-sn-glycerol-3-phosphate acyltransferase
MKVLKRIMRFIIEVISYIILKLVFWFKSEGRNNIPKNGSLIFCGNHRSFLDPVIIEVFSTRHMHFMSKEELKKNPITRFAVFVEDGIYVKRDEKDIASLKESLRILKDGRCLGIFPEGTRNGFEKNDGKVKNGAAYLALKTNTKVIPIGLSGKLKPFSKNKIKFGEPIDFAELLSTSNNKVDKEMEDKASEIIKEEILKLAN